MKNIEIKALTKKYEDKIKQKDKFIEKLSNKSLNIFDIELKNKELKPKEENKFVEEEEDRVIIEDKETINTQSSYQNSIFKETKREEVVNINMNYSIGY